MEFADSISWLVLLSKNNITADSLCLIFHMLWKNSEQPCRCLVRRLPNFKLWAYVECVAGKRPWAGFDNFFRTSLLFSCFSHVWGSDESWQNTSGSWWNGPEAVVCLTDVSKQALVVAAILFVFFAWYNPLLSTIHLWDCSTTTRWWSLKVHPKALKYHVCQNERLHTV